jgi:phosphate uptake regulator
MLSSVLDSERAIQENFGIMRTFVSLRAMIGSNKTLARRLNELEKKYDSQFRVDFEAIRELMAEPDLKTRRIGFKT